MLRLRDKQVAVVGGGKVAARKVKSLLRSGARVLLISPRLAPALQALADAGAIEWLPAAYQRDMLNEAMPLLVIAATADRRVNQIVAQDAQRIRALCNIVNDGAGGDFSNMATLDAPPLTIALSSNGASPALLRLLKEKLAAEIGAEYAVLADWLGGLRGTAPARSQAERQRLYEQLIASEVLTLLRAGKQDEAWQAFQRIITGAAPQ